MCIKSRPNSGPQWEWERRLLVFGAAAFSVPSLPCFSKHSTAVLQADPQPGKPSDLGPLDQCQLPFHTPRNRPSSEFLFRREPKTNEKLEQSVTEIIP